MMPTRLPAWALRDCLSDLELQSKDYSFTTRSAAVFEASMFYNSLKSSLPPLPSKRIALKLLGW